MRNVNKPERSMKQLNLLDISLSKILDRIGVREIYRYIETKEDNGPFSMGVITSLRHCQGNTSRLKKSKHPTQH